MKTKAQERREAAKVAAAQAREAATVRQQAFIDRLIATEGTILNRQTKYALDQLMWPYGQQRQWPSDEEMRSEAFREAVLGVMNEKLHVLMDYIEANPEASTDLEIVGETSVSGFDHHGNPETFYKIKDDGRIFYFSSVEGVNRMVDRQFFIDAARNLREEADRTEEFVSA